MGFVLDASVAVSWATETDAAVAVLRRAGSEEPHAPMLWWYEVHNALLMKERRGLHTPDTTDEFISLLAALGVTLDTMPDRREVVRLVRAYRLSAYDAAYLELAKRIAMPLATLDGGLARAAIAEGIDTMPLGPVE